MRVSCPIRLLHILIKHNQLKQHLLLRNLRIITRFLNFPDKLFNSKPMGKRYVVGTHKSQPERCRVHHVGPAFSSWWLQGGRYSKPTLCCLFFTFAPRKLLLFFQLLNKTRFSDRRTACCLLHYRLNSVQRMRRTIYFSPACVLEWAPFWTGCTSCDTYQSERPCL